MREAERGGKSSDELCVPVWCKQKKQKKKERTKKELLPSAYTAGSCPLSSKAFSSAALIITALFPQEGPAVICPVASADHHPSVQPPSSRPFSILIKAQDLRHQHHSNRVFVWLEGTWLHTHFFFPPLLIPFLHCELCKSLFFCFFSYSSACPHHK